MRRILGTNIATVVLAALCLCSTLAHGQSCPNPTRPDLDYNCPLGPVYTTPSWGNVPWLNPEYFETIQTGDVDGDGIDDLIARDASGLHLYMYDGSLGTWKPVLTTQGGDELVLAYFSDAQGWGTNKTYYGSIRLANLRDGTIKLVARAADGLTVFQFVRGDDQLGFPTGSWKQVSKAGPFSDKTGWLAAPYGLSLRYGRIVDNTDGMGVAVGWGKNGVETYRWNGTGWTPLPATPSFGDAATHAAAVLSLQIASIDSSTPDRLLVIGDNGLAAYGFEPGAGWQVKVDKPTGIFAAAGGCDGSTNSCAYTLQTVSLDGILKPVIMARTSGCKRRAGGMMGVTLNAENGQWKVLFPAGPFDDCPPNAFQDVRNFSSIMAADIDGDGHDELIGRGPNGILAYRWDKSTGRWSPMFANAPALSDDLWGSDPAYWASLRMAKIAGRKHALLARGASGMRTWLYDGVSFARPKPYGSFPDLDAASYQAVNSLLNLPNGVRLSYTDGTASTVMNSYITQLALICNTEIHANPPQFKECNYQGMENPAFTSTVNQLLRELTYAVASNSYFDGVNLMQLQLFSQENGEFPSIEDNLQLTLETGQAASVMPYLNLYTNIAKFVASLIGTEATIVVNGMAVAVSTIPLFQSTPLSIQPQQKYADVQATITNVQQQAQTNLTASKEYVAGDYALLSRVGQLYASQVWRPDAGAYLSAGRYGFTKWVMQQLLPTFYDTWDVHGCAGGQLVCGVPDGLSVYETSRNPDSGFDFIAILQKPVGDLPCSSWLGPGWCKFWLMTPPEGLQNLVFGELTTECKYVPKSTASWVYPSPNHKGCSLQAAPAIFLNEDGWTLNQNVCDAYAGGPNGPCSRFTQ